MEATDKEFKDLIESEVGMSVDEIRRQPTEDVTRHIEKKIGRRLRLSDPNPAIPYRGNILLALGRIAGNIDDTFNKTFGIR